MSEPEKAPGQTLGETHACQQMQAAEDHLRVSLVPENKPQIHSDNKASGNKINTGFKKKKKVKP